MERQVCTEEGYGRLEEDHPSQANECRHAEEIIRDDEGTVGRAEEGKDSIERESTIFTGRLVVQICKKWYASKDSSLLWRTCHQAGARSGKTLAIGGPFLC
jgi:hypothetical protein